MQKPYRYRSVLILAGVSAAALLALATGAVSLPRAEGTTHGTPTTAQQNLAAARTAANKQWAATTCTNILAWKNEIKRDATNLDLGFGAPARIQDAVGATTRMLSHIGLPPTAQGARARADAEALRSELESRVRNLQADAGEATSGNLAAIGKLLTDLSQAKAAGAQMSNELQRVVTVDLGLSLAETHACRELVGIPI